MYLSNVFRKSPQTLLAVLLMICLMQYVGAPTTTNAAITKRVYLTSGTTWTVPNDWVSGNNTIEAIGAGAHGTGGLRFTSGNGGAGGGYAKISNLSLTGGASVSYQVNTLADTVFNSTATTCAGAPTPSVCAKASGGAAALSIGTVKYTGGAGGDGTNSGGGGGGAAGPGGDGAGGEDGPSDGGAGGNGGNGSGGVGGSGDTSGFGAGDGGSGREYDYIPGHGSGGGGGGGLVGNAIDFFPGGDGGHGGLYGGGGGGGGSANGDPSTGMRGLKGNGQSGLIVITYESTDTGSPSQAKVKILGGQVKIIGGRVLIR